LPVDITTSVDKVAANEVAIDEGMVIQNDCGTIFISVPNEYHGTFSCCLISTQE